ncbi:MAG: UDP-glucose 4-epimerase GalE [Candidatus Saganbacteria bacterium]|nr:UDP-glucose 4-epimerase GalE [Candidatus Saganbacteria bacterium]
MRILITGGTGYIGSAAVHELIRRGHEVIVFDNLVYGHAAAIPKKVHLIEGDLTERKLVAETFERFTIEAVMHFASYTLVGESVSDPGKYFRNNIVGGMNLLEEMIEYNVKKIIFSSSAAVYGEPKKVPITENEPLSPTNPYGETKVMIEKIMKWFEAAYGLRYVNLRYFNAAGADIEANIGEDHDPETHLIPLVLETAMGKRKYIEVFGTDYPTSDGTCIRDYVHIKDIIHAHVLALEKLEKGGESAVYNLGTGKGASVKEVIDLVREVTAINFKTKEGKRRPGDPARLVASYDKAKKELGWEPGYSLKEIIIDAWEWRKKNPDGYK